MGTLCQLFFDGISMYMSPANASSLLYRIILLTCKTKEKRTKSYTEATKLK